MATLINANLASPLGWLCFLCILRAFIDKWKGFRLIRILYANLKENRFTYQVKINVYPKKGENSKYLLEIIVVITMRNCQT